MCYCCGCCVNNEPISKKAPPNLAESGTSSKAAVTQQPGESKARDSDCANYENVSIFK